MGADDATNVTIVDHLPNAVTLVSASAPGVSFINATSGDLVWQIPSIGSRESGTITLVVQISASAATGTTLSNQVAISSSPADSSPANNTETKSLAD